MSCIPINLVPIDSHATTPLVAQLHNIPIVSKVTMSTATYPTTPERCGPITAGWYAVSGAGIGAYQWSAWWPIEPTEHDIPTSQARGRESSKRAASRAAENAIACNGIEGRAVEVNKTFATPDKLRHAGSNEDDVSVIYDEPMGEDAATRRRVTKANAKGARAVADASVEGEATKRSTYRERVDGGAYWIAVMVAQGLGAPPPDYKAYGFTEAPAPPDWYRDPSANDNVADSAGPIGDKAVLVSALATLGLVEGVTLAEVRKAHRRLIFAVHPDRGGSEAACLPINAAYEIVLRLLPES